MGAARKNPGVPAWLYLVGAALIFGVIYLAPGVLDWVSDWYSDRMVESIDDMGPAPTPAP